MSTKTPLPKFADMFESSLDFLKNHFKELFAVIAIIVAIDGLVLASEPFISPVFGAIKHAVGPAGVLAVSLSVLFVLLLLVVFKYYSYAVAIKYVLGGGKHGHHKTIGSAYAQTLVVLISLIWCEILGSFMQFGAIVLFVIPLIVLAVYTAFWSYAVLDGRAKGIAAFVYSARLVHGYFWAVFGRLLLLGLLSGIFSVLAGAVITFVLYAMTGAGQNIFAFFFASTDLFRFAIEIGGIIPTIVTIIFAAKMYAALKALKEADGVSLDAAKLQELRGLFIGIAAWGLFASIVVFFIGISIVAVASISSARDRSALDQQMQRLQQQQNSSIGTPTHFDASASSDRMPL